jgi:hypothetical protein
LTETTPKTLNEIRGSTLASSLGIEFLKIGNDHIKARMPVEALGGHGTQFMRRRTKVVCRIRDQCQSQPDREERIRLLNSYADSFRKLDADLGNLHP